MNIRLWLAMLAAGLPQASQAHDWLTDLKSPTGELCCHDEDCPAVEHRYDRRAARLEVLIEGSWVVVERGALVSVPTPDGQAHACYGRSWLRNVMTPVVRCVIMPGEV